MFWCLSHVSVSSLVAQWLKRLSAMQKTWDSILGSGRYPGEGNGNPLQCSCLKNSMDRGAWWATVHGVAKSETRLSDFHSYDIPLSLTSASAYDLEDNDSSLWGFKKSLVGTSLVIQWLRFHTSTAGRQGTQVQSLICELYPACGVGQPINK